MAGFRDEMVSLAEKYGDFFFGQLERSLRGERNVDEILRLGVDAGDIGEIFSARPSFFFQTVYTCLQKRVFREKAIRIIQTMANRGAVEQFIGWRKGICRSELLRVVETETELGGTVACLVGYLADKNTLRAEKEPCPVERRSFHGTSLDAGRILFRAAGRYSSGLETDERRIEALFNVLCCWLGEFVRGTQSRAWNTETTRTVLKALFLVTCSRTINEKAAEFLVAVYTKYIQGGCSCSAAENKSCKNTIADRYTDCVFIRALFEVCDKNSREKVHAQAIEDVFALGREHRGLCWMFLTRCHCLGFSKSSSLLYWMDRAIDLCHVRELTETILETCCALFLETKKKRYFRVMKTLHRRSPDEFEHYCGSLSGYRAIAVLCTISGKTGKGAGEIKKTIDKTNSTKDIAALCWMVELRQSLLQSHAGSLEQAVLRAIRRPHGGERRTEKSLRLIKRAQSVLAEREEVCLFLLHRLGSLRFARQLLSLLGRLMTKKFVEENEKALQSIVGGKGIGAALGLSAVLSRHSPRAMGKHIYSKIGLLRRDKQRVQSHVRVLLTIESGKEESPLFEEIVSKKYSQFRMVLFKEWGKTKNKPLKAAKTRSGDLAGLDLMARKKVPLLRPPTTNVSHDVAAFAGGLLTGKEAAAGILFPKLDPRGKAIESRGISTGKPMSKQNTKALLTAMADLAVDDQEVQCYWVLFSLLEQDQEHICEAVVLMEAKTKWAQSTLLKHFICVLAEKCSKAQTDSAKTPHKAPQRHGADETVWRPCGECCSVHGMAVPCNFAGIETRWGEFSPAEKEVYALNRYSNKIRVSLGTRREMVDGMFAVVKREDTPPFFRTILLSAVFRVFLVCVLERQDTDCRRMAAEILPYVARAEDVCVVLRTGFIDQFMAVCKDSDSVCLFLDCVGMVFENKPRLFVAEQKTVERILAVYFPRNCPGHVNRLRRIVFSALKSGRRELVDSLHHFAIHKKLFFGLAVVCCVLAEQNLPWMVQGVSAVVSEFIKEHSETVDAEGEVLARNFLFIVFRQSSTRNLLYTEMRNAVQRSVSVANLFFPVAEQLFSSGAFSPDEKEDLLVCFSAHTKKSTPFLDGYYGLVLAVYTDERYAGSRLRHRLEQPFKQGLGRELQRAEKPLSALYARSLPETFRRRLESFADSTGCPVSGSVAGALLLETLGPRCGGFSAGLRGIFENSVACVEEVILVSLCGLGLRGRRRERTVSAVFASKTLSRSIAGAVELFAIRNNIPSAPGTPSLLMAVYDRRPGAKKKAKAFYSESNEEELLLGAVHSASLFPETRKGIELELAEEYSKAAYFYEQAMFLSLEESTKHITEESFIWEERWIECAKRMQQWGSLREITKSDSKRKELFVRSSFMKAFVDGASGYEAERQLYKKATSAGELSADGNYLQILVAVSGETAQEVLRMCHAVRERCFYQWRDARESPNGRHRLLVRRIKLLNIVCELLPGVDTPGGLDGAVSRWGRSTPPEEDDVNEWMLFAFVRERVLRLAGKKKEREDGVYLGAEIDKMRSFLPGLFRRKRFFATSLELSMQNAFESYSRMKEQAVCLFESNPRETVCVFIDEAETSCFSMVQQGVLACLNARFKARASREEAEGLFKEALTKSEGDRGVRREWARFSDTLYTESGDVQRWADAVRAYVDVVLGGGECLSEMLRVVSLFTGELPGEEVLGVVHEVVGRLPPEYWLPFRDAFVCGGEAAEVVVLEKMISHFPGLFYLAALREKGIEAVLERDNRKPLAQHTRFYRWLGGLGEAGEDATEYNKLSSLLFAQYRARHRAEKTDAAIGKLHRKRKALYSRIKRAPRWRVLEEIPPCTGLVAPSGLKIERMLPIAETVYCGEELSVRVCFVCEDGERVFYLVRETNTLSAVEEEQRAAALFVCLNTVLERDPWCRKRGVLFNVKRKFPVGRRRYLEETTEGVVSVGDIAGLDYAAKTNGAEMSHIDRVAKTEGVFVKRLARRFDSIAEYFLFRRSFAVGYAALCFCVYMAGRHEYHPREIRLERNGGAALSGVYFGERDVVRGFRATPNMWGFISDAGSACFFVPVFLQLTTLMKKARMEVLFPVFTGREMLEERMGDLYEDTRANTEQIVSIETNVWYGEEYPKHYSAWL
ncbi:MAG: uncharacterized protein A8A55_2154 [Amphiamblys sp. WSBS2006]|nr:MAG: uncharacterized protein A8A55_2154 [Amphiamblys sp. WSBS2006]